jgi:Inner membrane protein YgaP-like, transmembrane domain
MPCACNGHEKAGIISYYIGEHKEYKTMSVERTLFAFGGIMVMLTSLLALFHHPNWTWFTLFIGFNCFQSSFTGFCPPSWLMKKFGMKTEAELALGE